MPSATPRTATPPVIPGDTPAATPTPAAVDTTTPEFQAAVAAAVQAALASMALPTSATPAPAATTAGAGVPLPDAGPAIQTDQGWLVPRLGLRLTPPGPGA